MSTVISGIVKNGLVIPTSSLPEGAHVEIRLTGPGHRDLGGGRRLKPAELRELPRDQRQAVLAAAAELAEEDYRSDKELTGFDAFSEEEFDDDDPDSPQG